MPRPWDRIEAYCEDKFVFSVDSSHAPDRGDFLNVRKITYRVIGRTYTIDHVDEIGTCVNCVLNMERAP